MQYKFLHNYFAKYPYNQMTYHVMTSKNIYNNLSYTLRSKMQLYY